jgi:transcription termination factor NusB
MEQEREEAQPNKAAATKPATRKVTRNGKTYEMKTRTKPKKDPVEAALAKIVKIVESFSTDDQPRLVDAITDKLKGKGATA